MKVLIKQFLGKNHSWSVCGWGISEALISLGHSVDLFSTDGIQNLPLHLKPNLIGYVEENSQILNGKLPDNNYDCQISYTAMRNFSNYLSNGNKNRFGIWCYEWAGKNVLPNAFAKNHKYCDSLLAPTNFAKKIFMDSGIPESKVKMIPHGINVENYKQTSTLTLKTNKKFKILANIAQNHKRKNLPGLLEAYGKAFTKNDDVCLIIKGKNKEVKHPFEISLNECLNNFKKKYPNCAEIIVYSEFIEDISSLYRSIDVVFTLTHCEGFFFPGLESIASGKLVIAPNWGGQIDFLNNTNALLVEGKEVLADRTSMYWESKPNAIWFQPSIDDAVEKLKFAYSNIQSLNNNVESQRANVYETYSWTAVVKQFLSLCQ